jgi:uncharacterized protein involved in exopolysaccharide biosynthesis
VAPDAVGDLTALWRARWLLLGITLTAAIAGLVLSYFVPPTYESEANIRVGQVFGRPLENGYAVAALIGSEGFRTQLEQVLGQMIPRRSVRAETVEGGVGAAAQPAYVKVSARGDSADAAWSLAQKIVELLTERHQRDYEASVSKNRAYQNTLGTQIKGIEHALTEMEATLGRMRQNPGVSAPAILLLQGQVEEKQTQLLAFAKELRDSEIAEATETWPTQALAPPPRPRGPTWPVGLVVTAISTGFGLVAAIAWTLLRAPRTSAA